MDSINHKILTLENKIRALESKIKMVIIDKESKPPTPYTKISTSKGQGWWFIEGKWCTYAIYAD